MRRKQKEWWREEVKDRKGKGRAGKTWKREGKNR